MDWKFWENFQKMKKVLKKINPPHVPPSTFLEHLWKVAFNSEIVTYNCKIISWSSWNEPHIFNQKQMFTESRKESCSESSYEYLHNEIQVSAYAFILNEAFAILALSYQNDMVVSTVTIVSLLKLVGVNDEYFLISM